MRGKMIRINLRHRAIPTETHILSPGLIPVPMRALHNQRKILDWRLPRVGSCQYEVHITVGSPFACDLAIRNLLQHFMQPAIETKAVDFFGLILGWLRPIP